MGLAVVIIAAVAILVWNHHGSGFTPSNIPPPATIDRLVDTILEAEKDIAVLRAIATKLTQGGYGAQAARVLQKANSLEAQALGMSQVQLAIAHSSMAYQGGSQ